MAPRSRASASAASAPSSSDMHAAILYIPSCIEINLLTRHALPRSCILYRTVLGLLEPDKLLELILLPPDLETLHSRGA